MKFSTVVAVIFILAGTFVFSSCEDVIRQDGSVFLCGNGVLDTNESCDIVNGLAQFSPTLRCESGVAPDVTKLTCKSDCSVVFGADACHQDIELDCEVEGETRCNNSGELQICKDNVWELDPSCITGMLCEEGTCVSCHEASVAVCPVGSECNPSTGMCEGPKNCIEGTSLCSDRLPICSNVNNQCEGCHKQDDGNAACRRMDPSKGHCVTDGANAGACVECIESLHCPEESPICSDNVCSPCSDALACNDGMVCDPATGKCNECIKQDLGTESPYCVAPNRFVTGIRLSAPTA
ncbi:MAG: hypothetical protein ACOX8U_08855 [Bradymonadia bacterium]|jgi:hypothetical protein